MPEPGGLPLLRFAPTLLASGSAGPRELPLTAPVALLPLELSSSPLFSAPTSLFPPLLLLLLLLLLLAFVETLATVGGACA